MKRVVLVVGLLLVVGTLFAAGRAETPGIAKQAQTKAQTGECDSDCDGEPDQVRLRDRLQDGSCRDDLTVTASEAGAENADRDRLRTQDGDHDGEPDLIQTKDRTRLSRPTS